MGGEELGCTRLPSLPKGITCLCCCVCWGVRVLRKEESAAKSFIPSTVFSPQALLYSKTHPGV